MVARTTFTIVANIVKKSDNKELEGGICLSRYEFDFLTYLEKHGKRLYSQRKLADDLTITLSNVSKLQKDLLEHDYIN